MKLPASPLLIVTHNIYLTKEERYLLVDKRPIDVIGVSLPIWFAEKNISEPAEEVFCKYNIDNEPLYPSGKIVFTKEGYRINLPQLPEDWKPPQLDDDTWRGMDEKELSNWYAENATPPNANNLKDIKSGGSECLKFKYMGEYEKFEKIRVMHYCAIKSIEILENSII